VARLSLLVVILGALTVAPGGGARSAGSFPCQWKYDLEVGLRAGYVTAGESAACAGRLGRLTLSAQLFRWIPATGRWHLDRKQTTTFTNLSHNRYVELVERCRAGKVRAVFRWQLRDTGGRLVATNLIRTAPVGVPGPACQLTLGNP